jgi:hypothetical protein
LSSASCGFSGLKEAALSLRREAFKTFARLGEHDRAVGCERFAK